MRALVVGFGSIGARHARVLSELGCEVALVSRRQPETYRCYRDIEEALQQFAPQYVVIANETSLHHRVLSELAAAGYGGVVLVEKPLFQGKEELPDNGFSGRFVGYNMRFHPLMLRLRELLAEEKILSVQAYVGQYLPTWRPDRDYRKGYSADKAAGGGVLRDLSHELDYLNWLCGGWRRLTALGGHFSPLEISSDDLFALMMETARCPVVSVQVSYLDRVPRRQVIINTAAKTITADLVSGWLQIDGEREEATVERDLTYREMHRAVVEGRREVLCSFAEGMDVMEMIMAAEEAAVSGRWIWK